MKASELKPGQFFERKGSRRLCCWQNPDDESTGFVTEFGYLVVSMSNDLEVTPLAVTGWDDEPKPASGVSLIAAERERQIGKEGWSSQHDDNVNRKGELAKAAICYAAISYTWSEPEKLERIWPYDSEWFKPSATSSIRNLVKAGALIAAEIDRLQRTKSPEAPPVAKPEQNRPAIADAIESAAAAFHQKLKEPEQFKAGDWVVADSACSKARYGETPKQLIEATKWSVYVEEKFPYHSSHFRRATPDEVAEQQRKDYWQHPVVENKPDADGWIAWKGGKCPVADGTIVDLKFRKPDDFGDIAEREQCQDWDWSHAPLASDSDIIAYRLVNPPEPELQPILDWVEVVTR